MKKLLFALTLFSITPLCAMKRESPDKQVEKEIKKIKRTEQEQEELDSKLLESMDDFKDENKELESPENVEALLKQGANPNARYLGYPYLRFTRNRCIIRILLDYGADMLQGDSEEGNTVFHDLVTMAERDRLALFLLHARERNIDFKKITSQKNKDGETPLSLAKDAFVQTHYSWTLDQCEVNLVLVNHFQIECLILTDPDKNIPELLPEVVEQFQQEQIKATLKKAGTQSIHQYLLNREIGRK